MAETGRTRAPGAGSGQLRRTLVVSVALAWCLMLEAVLLGAGPGQVWAAGAHSSHTSRIPLPATGTSTSTPTNTPTATPTTAATNTPTTAPTKTSAPTATAAPTAAPTSGGSSNGGGVGPQPTRQSLAQPTIGTSQSGPAGSFTPSDLTSPWLLVFSTLGCVLGLLALGTVLVTWYLLASDGWGPVIKAVLLGNRKGRRRFGMRESGPARGARRPEPMPVAAPRSRGAWR
jgi:hypothetical protein